MRNRKETTVITENHLRVTALDEEEWGKVAKIYEGITEEEPFEFRYFERFKRKVEKEFGKKLRRWQVSLIIDKMTGLRK